MFFLFFFLKSCIYNEGTLCGGAVFGRHIQGTYINENTLKHTGVRDRCGIIKILVLLVIFLFCFLALMVMTVSLHLAVTQAAVTYLTSEEPRPHANIVHRDDLSRDNHSVEGGTSRGRYVLNQNIGSLFRLLFGDTFLLPLPQRHSDCVISPG